MASTPASGRREEFVVGFAKYNEGQFSGKLEDGNRQVVCALCHKSEPMSTFHSTLFHIWHARPIGTKYLPAVRIGKSGIASSGNGLFANEDIFKQETITYYPSHAVCGAGVNGQRSFFTHLSQIPLEEMTNSSDFQTKLTERSLSHLAQGCAFDAMSWPSCKRRDDELADCANDSVNLVDLLEPFRDFMKNPSAITYVQFIATVEDFSSSSNCRFVSNCGSLDAESGTFYMRSSRHGPETTEDLTPCPVPSVEATRDIKCGEELTVSYGGRYWLLHLYVMHKKRAEPHKDIHAIVADYNDLLDRIDCN